MRQVGQGRVIYWNTAVLSEKIMRGLVVQSVAAVQRIAVLPIANVGVLQVDDLPPMDLDGALEPVASEFGGMTCMEFYEDVWLPDILDLAKRYDLLWSFFPIFNYDGLAQPPFSGDYWRRPMAEEGGVAVPYRPRLARRAASHGELGLHGYDHLQLTNDLWASNKLMVAGLRTAMDEWRDTDLGALPRSYVPPNNEYDEMGAKALTEAIPSLETVSGLYLAGDPERGGGREFGPEPWNPKLYCLPRTSGGYVFDSTKRLAAISLLATMGVWTHFVHADDVYDIEVNALSTSYQRNPLGRWWRGRAPGGHDSFRDTFEAWLVSLRRMAPWLRFMTTTKGAKEMEF